MGNGIYFWIKERLRDLLMWPVNLVRDFPLRARRLLGTLARAVNGVIFFFPELSDARRHNEVGSWLRSKAGRLADGLHQLVSQIFDLIGGPEIVSFFMHLFTKTSPLTSDETRIISEILGPRAMRYADIRVVEGGLFDLVFRFNGNLAFTTWHSINLPRKGNHARKNRGIVVHELTHVYQYEQVGSRYLGEAIYMLIKTKRDCYHYGGMKGLAAAGATGRRYRHYNREQQAMIIQDYYQRREQGRETATYEPFIAQLRSGEL